MPININIMISRSSLEALSFWAHWLTSSLPCMPYNVGKECWWGSSSTPLLHWSTHRLSVSTALAASPCCSGRAENAWKRASRRTLVSWPGLVRWLRLPHTAWAKSKTKSKLARCSFGRCPGGCELESILPRSRRREERALHRTVWEQVPCRERRGALDPAPSHSRSGSLREKPALTDLCSRWSGRLPATWCYWLQ